MRNLLICVGLVAITFAVYWPVRGFEFVNFDDGGYVTENPHINQGLNSKTFSYAFHSTDLANYHPLTWLSFALDVSLFGVNPGPMHLENVLIHAVNGALIFLFLLQATGDLRPSLFCALVFAVHPAHVESVAWIAERKDVLSGLFFMLGLLTYLKFVRSVDRSRRLAWYVMTAVLLTLGLLAKPMIVTFPFVLLLLDYWPLGRTARGGPSASWKFLLLEKLPLIGVVIAASIVTYQAQHGGGAMIDFSSLPLPRRIADTSVSYVRYLGKFLWPSGLSIFYPRLKNVPPIAVALCMLALVSITLVCARLRRPAPYLIVGWLLFLGSLIPVIGIIQVGWQSIADRYLYLPMIGPLVMLAWGAQAIGRRLKNATIDLWFPLITGSTVLLILSAVTRSQIQFWHDTRSLFNHALAVNAQNPVAHLQLGYLDARLGHFDDAKQHYEQAIRIDPTYFVSDFDLANLLLNNHQPEQSLVYYQQAAANAPGVARVENNWGIALLQTKRPREAFEHFRAAETDDPELPDAHFNLGQLFLEVGRIDSAEAEFRTTLHLDPDHTGALKGMQTVRAARGVTAARG